MVIIGIDPGKSGGVAWYDTHNKHMLARKLDTTEADISEIFKSFTLGECHAYIEKVHSMPKQGVKSMFTFGQNYGFLRGCLISHGIPFDEVRPIEWQKALGAKSGGDKNITKAKAQQLYPEITVTHAIADAILICEYGRRVYSSRV